MFQGSEDTSRVTVPEPKSPGAIGWLVATVLAVMGLITNHAAARQEATSSGEITITAPWFGVGGVIRPGDWAALRLSVQDSASRQREVLLRITLPDADGDRAQFESLLTTNPGVDQQHWMYVYLGPRFGMGDVVEVRAFAAIEQPGSRGSFAAGRLLGTSRLQARSVAPRVDGLLAIVGTQPMGLTKYQAGNQATPGLTGGHERLSIVQGLDADALPDRWIGLAPFEALVWTAASPGTLGSGRAAAIREWVERGGHLIVVLPRVAQSWTDQTNNPLFDITPRVRITRREGVDLEPYRQLITQRPPPGSGPQGAAIAMPRSEVLQSFAPLSDAGPTQAIPILTGPTETEVLVVRRLVGNGMVTLLGLDLTSRWMSERGMPEAEMFWHRVLGRRGVHAVSTDPNAPIRLSDREPITLDRDIGDQIAKTGRAEIGVLLGIGVFIVYWLVAGPLGFMLLRRTGRAKHGWLGFVAAAAAFTAIAWGGAAAIRPSRVDASHLTIIDHVFGQDTQRARSWVSLLIPTYGEATLQLRDPAEPGSPRFSNLLAPWEPENTTIASFPDARGYRVDSKAPDQLTIPTRSTVKQLQLDWTGGPQWRMPRPIGTTPDGSPPTLFLTDDPAASRGLRQRIKLNGILQHDLPGPLTDAIIIVNRGQRPLNSSLGRTLGERTGGPILWDTAAYALPQPWAAGETIDLGAIPFEIDRSAEYLKKLLANDIGATDGSLTPDIDRSRTTARLTAIALLSQLEPPPPTSDSTVRRERLAQRRSTHGFDMGEWLTQPSVIIIGHVGSKDTGPPTPVPLYITQAGQTRKVDSAGRTVVRWVYPLTPRPPTYPTTTEPATTEPASGPADAPARPPE